MEIIDAQLQKRVWDRVRGANVPRELESRLPDMIAHARTAATAYRQLIPKSKGRSAALLGQMHRQALEQLSNLKGIYTRLTGKPPLMKAPQVPPLPRPIALRQCYHRALQQADNFQRLQADPQFGPQFQRMLLQTRGHCKTLSELLSEKSSG